MAREARRSAFTVATCIHPSLVPLLNKAYSPSQAELDLALRHIAAADAAAPERHGSFQVDGRVVDEPILRRVCQIVAASRGTAEAGG